MNINVTYISEDSAVLIRVGGWREAVEAFHNWDILPKDEDTPDWTEFDPDMEPQDV